MRIAALVKRILRQFLRDKRTLALMIVAPIGILFLMSLVFNGDQYTPKIAAVHIPDSLTAQMKHAGAKVYDYSSEQAEAKLADNKIDAILTLSGTTPQLKLEGSDPSANKSVILLMQSMIQRNNPAGPLGKPEISYLHGSADMASFDNFGPVLIGFFTFFFVFLIAGVSFLRERTGGTLERLLATPLRRWEIVVGYVGGFGIFTMIQAALIAWFSIDVLGMMMEGSFWLVLLVTLLLALTALTLGTFMSAFAGNELQMIQFMPLVVVPQVFFSGLFNLETMHPWLRGLGDVMPLTYGARALRDVMIRGKGWSAIDQDVYVLVGFCLFFMAANVLALRKHRKI